jgi:hypothetical protein
MHVCVRRPGEALTAACHLRPSVVGAVVGLGGWGLPVAFCRLLPALALLAAALT